VGDLAAGPPMQHAVPPTAPPLGRRLHLIAAQMESVPEHRWCRQAAAEAQAAFLAITVVPVMLSQHERTRKSLCRLGAMHSVMASAADSGE